ncbi:TetR family transcriptional regulator [Advenella incenata]|jgi:AcrR family transcriptional regulator|uniref:TetR family transcriptional regulator n=1 Tax=Advenella incenata TaxID=267800 RepID=A0A4Q7V782_9BURK|nr:TetR family transcriptional regulator [Advenella incenata]RZT92215.1 TetR family transcriptional regulator [Advenella incenata]
MSTKEKITASALTLFATRGFDAISLKDITTLADVNVAAIHYHFGNKDDLIRAVLESVAQPINALRMQALEKLSGDGMLTLERIVDALVAPPIMHSLQTTGDSRLLVRLLMQARALPQATTNVAIFEQYDAMALLFVESFMKVTPGLNREEAFWRYSFTIGAMMYIISDGDKNYHRLNRLSAGLCDTDDPTVIIKQLVAFVVAGFSAPNVSKTVRK